MWNLFDDNDLNEMECRLKEAIIWTAKATHENDDSIAYVECFLALEAILMEQDGFINKSITAQISEYVAFLLCKELDKRIALEKKLKQLYKIRSAIAHGKNINNISMEVRDIFKIVKHVIYLILYADKNTRKFKNIKELRDFITILKFK